MELFNVNTGTAYSRLRGALGYNSRRAATECNFEANPCQSADFLRIDRERISLPYAARTRFCRQGLARDECREQRRARLNEKDVRHGGVLERHDEGARCSRETDRDGDAGIPHRFEKKDGPTPVAPQ